MKIVIIGSGYVGLVAGACFADAGYCVFCVDKDENKISTLKKGEIPIFEPGLDVLVQRGLSQKRLHFTTSLTEAVAGCDFVFLAVGTPAQENGEPDLSFLREAAVELGRCLTGSCIVVNKSTVPVGCHQWVRGWIAEHSQYSFEVISNPEFLKEGTAVEDFLKPDRVIIGTKNEAAYKKMESLYRPFVRQGNPILWMDPISSEMAKYACNAYLATRISFMNELSHLCDQIGGDIEQIRRGMTTDTRIGKHFLYAGAGYGGSCFPKDVQALLFTAQQNKASLQIVQSAHNANDRQKKHLVRLVKQHFGENLKGKVFAVWGLAFKPNTDDIREAPSLTIIEGLLGAQAVVKAYDPVATENARHVFGNRVEFCHSSEEAIKGADALLVVTEWNEFRHPDLLKIKSLLKQPIVFDGRNLFEPSKMAGEGFQYFGIGRSIS